MYDTLQLSFLTTHYETSTINNYYTDEFSLYTVPHYITRKKHPIQDNYLYRQWNNPTKKNRKTNQCILTCSSTKDDPSVTPTLDTLYTSTLDTRSSHPTNTNNDMSS